MAQGATPAPTETAAPDGVLVTSSDGITVTAKLAAPVVAPGGSLGISVTIANGRPTQLVLQSTYCGAPALVTAYATNPAVANGRAWDGLAGRYKAFALGQAQQSGEIGVTPLEAATKPCPSGGGWVVNVPAGGRISTSFALQADLVDGVPAQPADSVLLEISVGYDPTCTPGNGMICGTIGSRGGCVFCLSWKFKQLTLAGTFVIAGKGPAFFTAAEAIDTMLGDHRFATWLAKEPPTTWTTSNVVLENEGPAQGIVPAGPNWLVELIRENPHNWASGYVDPSTGKLRSLTFCNSPCWR